jgi:hypothetical protein
MPNSFSSFGVGMAGLKIGLGMILKQNLIQMFSQEVDVWNIDCSSTEFSNISSLLHLGTRN